VTIPDNRRLECTKWGTKPTLRVTTGPLEAVLAPGLIVIKTHSACFSTLDVKLCLGHFRRKFRKRPPHGLGYDFSGTVTHINDIPGRFKVGDSVFGSLPLDQPGAASDNLLVNESWCAPKPDSLSHDLASCLGSNCLLAYSALQELAVTLDDRVLVLGGASGAGHMLIQLAKELFEVEWLATTSTHAERGFCEDCGADEVFDFQVTKTHWALPFLKTHRYDVVLDCVGDPAAFALARRGLTLLPGEAAPGWFGCRPQPELPRPDGEVLERLGVLAVLGKLVPRFSLCGFSDAIGKFTDSRLLVIKLVYFFQVRFFQQ